MLEKKKIGIRRNAILSSIGLFVLIKKIKK